MDIYSPNTAVVVSFDLIDQQGNVIDPISATYEVRDDLDALIDSGSVAVAGGETVLAVTVAAGFNVPVSTVGARIVLLSVVAATGTHILSSSYIIETFGFLTIPTESGQTELQASMLSISIPGLDAWDSASDRDRKAALKTAWSRLSRLSYKPWRSYDDTTTASASFPTLLLGDFRLNELTVDDWAGLPAPFVTALRRAQLVESEVLLDGDPTWDRRVDGLISKTVGESSEMFRSGKPVITAASSKALRELSGFLDFSVKIGRG